ncbi:hypothetical protein IB234_22750 [Pseudomonas sp. PDM16]|uniref:Imm43 family immunity protein n=1 Tax=Pseudomonas sp. PDM16 TaxID=2769292 RepID=UPI001782645B|nr:DUF1629 domain-containing protein [Pseudomonas sp. PDM16]MBD9417392.1 hypothetical protein [Pseudomonas sp. PDM16]
MRWYIVDYDISGKKGCPPYLKGELNHDWEWDDYDPDPFKFEISDDYVFKARHNFLNFDFWDSGPLVSERFVKICERFGVAFRLVPVRMIQSGGEEAEKKYYYILLDGQYGALDYKESKLKFYTDLRTGEVLYRKHCPTIPRIISVYRAVIDNERILGKHIFKCVDFSGKLVCSEEFKVECEENSLLGVKFIEIDEGFQYLGVGG